MAGFDSSDENDVDVAPRSSSSSSQEDYYKFKLEQGKKEEIRKERERFENEFSAALTQQAKAKKQKRTKQLNRLKTAGKIGAAGVKAGARAVNKTAQVGAKVGAQVVSGTVGAAKGLVKSVHDFPGWYPGAMIFIGALDFYWSSKYGISEFSIYFDFVILLFAFLKFQNITPLVVGALEIFWPNFALRFSGGNLSTILPFWLFFGIMLLLYDIFVKKQVSQGDKYTIAAGIIVLIGFFGLPGIINSQQLMAQDVDTTQIDQIINTGLDQAQQSAGRWTESYHSLKHCLLPEWLGNTKDCSELERSLVPEATDVAQTEVDKKAAGIDYSLKINPYRTVHPTEFDLYMSADWSITSPKYPIQGIITMALEAEPEILGKSTRGDRFVTSLSGNLYKDEQVFSAMWKGDQLPLGGKSGKNFDVKVSAAFIVQTEANYDTYFYNYDDNARKAGVQREDVRKENPVFKQSNMIAPETEMYDGPVLLSMGFGDVQSPIMIGMRGNPEPLDFFITFRPKKLGSTKEKLYMINRVLIKEITVPDESDPTKSREIVNLSGCGYYSKNGDVWELKTDYLTKLNDAVFKQQTSSSGWSQHCPITADPKTIFKEGGPSLVPVKVGILIQYTYLVTDKTTIKISSDEDYKEYSCIGGESQKFVNNELGQDDIDRAIIASADAHSVPRMIALSVAQRESGRKQYEKDGAVVRNPESPDYGVMQINSNAHDITDLMCDYKANIDYGLKFLKSQFDVCGNWPGAINRYHSGTSPSLCTNYALTDYVDMVQDDCEKLGKDFGWNPLNCKNCIKDEDPNNCEYALGEVPA